ncbi:MAG: glycosyltransferase family 2 protein [Bdellovibrionales bacterium]
MQSIEKLSIIIPTHRNPLGVQAFLESLEKQVEIGFIQLEVLVVSNLNDPQLDEILAKSWTFPVKGFVSGVIGVNAARNTGVRLASGDWFYFVDDDCRFIHPDHLSRLHQIIRTTREPIVGVGGGYTIADKSSLADIAYMLTCQHWLDMSKTDEGDFHLVGGNACICRKIFDAGYTYNESILFGGAETEFNLRLCGQGFRFNYNSKLNLLHETKMTLGSLCRKAFLQGMGWGIREYYGVKEMSSKKMTLVEYLASQNYSGLAKSLLSVQLYLYDMFYLTGFNYFKAYKKTEIHQWNAFLGLVQEFERRTLQTLKNTKMGRFYQRGLLRRRGARR